MQNLAELLDQFRALPANRFPEAREDANYLDVRQHFEYWIDARGGSLDTNAVETLKHLEDLIYLDDLERRFKFAELTGDADVYARIRRYMEEQAPSDLIAKELGLIFEVPNEKWTFFLESQKLYSNWQEPEEDGTDKTLRFLQLPGYLEFAESAYRDAVKHIQGIHDGTVPYAADKAWVLEDGHLLGRIARVALASDQPWCRELLPDLLLGACVAPSAKIKSAPSQSATIQIGHAIAAHPRRWAIVALNEAQKTARHAGLKKKLRNDLKVAETALISDPAFFRNLPATEPLPKRLKSTLAKAVERLLMDAEPIQRFKTDFFAHKDLQPIAGLLIWSVKRESEAFNAVPSADGPAWVLANGTRVEMHNSDFAKLWHPIESETDEVDAWEEWFAQAGLTQPFAQIHREQYELKPEDETETLMFAGHDIWSSPFLAVSRGFGWAVAWGALHLSFREYVFALQTDGENLYPSAPFQTKGLKLLAGANTLSEVEPRVISEVLRQVDLFTTLGIEALYRDRFPEGSDFNRAYAAFSDNSDPFEPGQKTLQGRKHAIQSLFRSAIEEGTLKLGRRSVSFGDYTLHLGTMRLTCRGKLVDRPDALTVEFLPYRDETLRHAVEIIAAGLRAG